MYMNVSDFRKDIKNQLDKVIQGELVVFERAGVQFQVITSGVMPSISGTSVQASEFGEERLINGVCKIHGTPLDSRGRCLQKGCKYA